MKRRGSTPFIPEDVGQAISQSTGPLDLARRIVVLCLRSAREDKERSLSGAWARVGYDPTAFEFKYVMYNGSSPEPVQILYAETQGGEIDHTVVPTVLISGSEERGWVIPSMIRAAAWVPVFLSSNRLRPSLERWKKDLFEEYCGAFSRALGAAELACTPPIYGTEPRVLPQNPGPVPFIFSDDAVALRVHGGGGVQASGYTTAQWIGGREAGFRVIAGAGCVAFYLRKVSGRRTAPVSDAVAIGPLELRSGVYPVAEGEVALPLFRDDVLPGGAVLPLGWGREKPFFFWDTPQEAGWAVVVRGNPESFLRAGRIVLSYLGSSGSEPVRDVVLAGPFPPDLPTARAVDRRIGRAVLVPTGADNGHFVFKKGEWSAVLRDSGSVSGLIVALGPLCARTTRPVTASRAGNVDVRVAEYASKNAVRVADAEALFPPCGPPPSALRLRRIAVRKGDPPRVASAIEEANRLRAFWARFEKDYKAATGANGGCGAEMSLYERVSAVFVEEADAMADRMLAT